MVPYYSVRPREPRGLDVRWMEDAPGICRRDRAPQGAWCRAKCGCRAAALEPDGNRRRATGPAHGATGSGHDQGATMDATVDAGTAVALGSAYAVAAVLPAARAVTEPSSQCPTGFRRAVRIGAQGASSPGAQAPRRRTGGKRPGAVRCCYRVTRRQEVPCVRLLGAPKKFTRFNACHDPAPARQTPRAGRNGLGRVLVGLNHPTCSGRTCFTRSRK